jgi:putative SOS response-associated peptidase YedK
MCGRFILGIQGQLWPELIELYPEGFNVVPRYNVAPTQNIPVVRNDRGQNRLDIMRWGLVPFYEKEFKTKFPMINARDDRILETRPYQGPFKSRRCLIPATGFYEWKKGPGKAKQPMLIRLKTRETFAFAGIWERWTDRENPDAGERLSCSIITTRPN